MCILFCSFYELYTHRRGLRKGLRKDIGSGATHRGEAGRVCANSSWVSNPGVQSGCATGVSDPRPARVYSSLLIYICVYIYISLLFFIPFFVYVYTLISPSYLFIIFIHIHYYIFSSLYIYICICIYIYIYIFINI